MGDSSNGRAAAGSQANGTTSGPAPGKLRAGPHYKWLALSNTTLGMLAATANASIVIIALPAIFRGIKLNPLTPGNVELPALDADGVPGGVGRAGGHPGPAG